MIPKKRQLTIIRYLLVCLALLATALPKIPIADAQIPVLTEEEHRLFLSMLSDIRVDLKNNYYDPKFHGVDIDLAFRQASRKLSMARTGYDGIRVLAELLFLLNDSQTFLIVSGRWPSLDLGLRLSMIGNSCYVVGVTPNSSADKKGIKIGAQILSIGGITPTRIDFWRIPYFLSSSLPHDLNVTVKDATGATREIALTPTAEILPADIKPDSVAYWAGTTKLIDKQPLFQNSVNRFSEFGEDLIIWKMARFSNEDKDVDAIFQKIKQHRGLIIDVRGNPSGDPSLCLRVLANLFDHDVKMYSSRKRKIESARTASGRGKDCFAGKVIVLVDAQSSNAAEVLARVIQIEKRGIVVGDRTAGQVMETSIFRSYAARAKGMTMGARISVADVIMPDGNRLEHVGVTPDEKVLPTVEDLIQLRDPAMSRAAELIGVKIDPARAGALFPTLIKE